MKSSMQVFRSSFEQNPKAIGGKLPENDFIMKDKTIIKQK